RFDAGQGPGRVVDLGAGPGQVEQDPGGGCGGGSEPLVDARFGVDSPRERGDGVAGRLDREVEVDPAQSPDQGAARAADEVEAERAGGAANRRQRRYPVEALAQALGRDLGFQGAHSADSTQPSLAEPYDRFPTMTGFPDVPRARHLALVGRVAAGR